MVHTNFEVRNHRLPSRPQVGNENRDAVGNNGGRVSFGDSTMGFDDASVGSHSPQQFKKTMVEIITILTAFSLTALGS